jgi:two-component system, cell cycle sensor histidine kinase and response regulator CckA
MFFQTRTVKLARRHQRQKLVQLGPASVRMLLDFMRSLGFKATLASIGIAALLFAGVYLVRPRIGSRVYRIGWQNSPPFQEKADDGSPAGLAIELVREAARRRGVQLQWVWYPGSSEAALRNGDVDLWPLITITPERQREKAIYISKPYLQHDHSLLVLANSPFAEAGDLASGTVSHMSLAISIKFMRDILPHSRSVLVDSDKEAVDNVCAGRTDAAFLDQFTAASILFNAVRPCADPLREIALPALRSRLGVGSTLKATVAADEIRRGIDDSAMEGDLAKILKNGGYHSPRDLEYFNALFNAQRRERWLIAAIGLFMCLLAITLFAAIRISRQRNRITATERALRESEHRLRLIANNLSEMVWMYDMDRHLVFANKSIEHLTGYSADELSNKNLISWIHWDDRSRMAGYWDKLFEGAAYRDEEYRLITKDGRIRWVMATWAPIYDETGRQCGVQGTERNITEKRIAEQLLRESEGRFRELLEGVQLVAAMTDPDGNISFCNDYTLAISGWSREEVIGRPAEQLFETTPPFHIAGEVAKWRDQTHASFEGSLLEKNGGRRSVQWSFTPLHDSAGHPSGFASLGQDVTEVRTLRLIAAQRESEARFHKVADTAPLMIWELGPDGGCTFVNHRWCAFTGISVEQALGNGWSASVHPEDLESCRAIMTAAFDARRDFQVEHRTALVDRAFRWVLGSGVPRFGLDGSFEGYVGTCTDITDLKRSRDEQMDRQKLETVGRLVSGIAHEFNNIMGGMLIQADLAVQNLSDRDGPADQLNAIRGLAIRAAGVVRQLMIYAGHEDAGRESFDISRLIRETADLLRVVVPKRIDLNSDLCPSLPAVHANPAQLRQLVMNLVTNAADAIGEHHGVIAIRTRGVTSPNPAGGPDCYVELAVSDSGCGVDPAVLEKIFDPFFTTKPTGHGLGLAVVNRIVHDVGGHIQVETEAKRGTTFRIFLPGYEPAEAAPTITTGELEKDRGELVLVVEDEASLRIAAARILSAHSCSVLEAADGTTALSLVGEYWRDLTAILLDITLPGASSADVFTEARRLRPDIKIVVTSAYGRTKVDECFPGMDIDAFIRKPYRLTELVALMNGVLARNKPS